MKILLLLLLAVMPIQARQVKLAWDLPSNPIDIPNIGYYVYRWDTNPYTDPNISDRLDFRFYRYVWTNATVGVEIPDNEVSWFGVLQNDTRTGFSWSQIIKSSLNKTISLGAALETNPYTGLYSFKLTVNGDAGTMVTIESSPDLVNWSFVRSIIIGQLFQDGIHVDILDYDKSNIYYALTPQRFYRAYKTPSNISPPIFIEFQSLTSPAISTPVIPVDTISITPPVTVTTTPKSTHKRPESPYKKSRKQKIDIDRKKKKK